MTKLLKKIYKRSTALTAVSGILAGAGLVGTPAVAQAQERSSTALEVINVTSRNRVESLLEIPLSVTAFSEVELQRQNVFSLEDLAQYTPGLQFQDVNGAFQNPSLRGLTQTDQTSAQGNVGIFIDGVYLNNRSSLEFGALDLARIEVVKGPQSALYGRNTFGGAINYVTKDAELGEASAAAEATFGNRGRLQLGGNANLPLGDFGAVQLFAGISEFDGTIANNGPGDDFLGGWSKRNAYGGKIYLEPQEGFRLTFFGMYSEQQNDAPALVSLDPRTYTGGNLVSVPEGNINTLFGAELPQFREVTIFPGRGLFGDTTLLYAKAEFDLPFATVTALGSYLDSTSALQIVTNNNIDSVNTPGFIPGFSAQAALDVSTPEGQSESFELKMAQNDGGFDWMVGGFYFNSFDSDTLSVFFLPLGGEGEPFFFFGRDREVTTQSFAAFGSASYEFNDRLTASAELRYTTEDLTLESGIDGPEELDFSYLTPRFIVDYKINDSLMAYANIGRGVKTGGFAGQPRPGETQSITFNEETNWSYEVGLKGSAFDGSLIYQAAAYYIKWNDVQIQTALEGAPISVVQNFGSITSMGVELDATYYITENFWVRSGVAILDPTYDDGFIDGESIAPCGEAVDSDPTLIIEKGCTADVSGNLVARTSDFQASVSATYQVPDVIADFAAYLRVDYSFESPKFPTGLQLSSQGNISLTNIRLGLSNDQYEIAFWVDNLFNETWNRRTTVAPLQTFGGNAAGVRDFRVYPGDLRTFGVNITARF